MVFKPINTDKIHSIVEDSGMVTIGDSDKVCELCNSQNTIKYEIKELYKKSYCYKCLDCNAFAVEEENNFNLKWFKNTK